MWSSSYKAKANAKTLVILIALATLLSATAGPALDEGSSETGESSYEVHSRWKREDEAPSKGWKIPGTGLFKKLKKLVSSYQNLPPNLKHAIEEQDFSNVTEQDIKEVNITVLECIPRKVYEKADVSLLSAFIDKFVENNRPSALGRLVESAGVKLDTNYLLDKLKKNQDEVGGEEPNDAGSVLLYNAMSKLGDKGITKDLANRLVRENLIEDVPEEQLMKVEDPNAAKTLLNAVTKSKNRDVDDRSLIVKLTETAFGPAKSWTQDTILKHVGDMPAAFLKNLNPTIIKATDLPDLVDTPLQAKAIADVYLENSEVAKNAEGLANTYDLSQLTSRLGKLSAFLPPSLTKDSNILTTIINSCDKLKLPAPIQSITRFFEEKLSGNRKVEDMSLLDLQVIPAAVMKNSPPDVIQRAISERAIDPNVLQDMADPPRNQAYKPDAPVPTKQPSFFQGVLSQLASYAMEQFKGSNGQVDLFRLPAAFFGALGIKGFDGLHGNSVDSTANKIKNNPDALDDIQKAMLIKKINDGGGGRDVVVPPELSDLLPRPKKMKDHSDEDVRDLPSDSEQRLAFKNGQRITPDDLDRFPSLIGTLTPKQVESFDLDDIPSVLAMVRRSRDGPQSQTLKALHTRFIAYIRLKADDYETENDKKLLKHLTPAEVSKLPGTVLAYFIDHRQTGKLPAATRKEIMIAMGELSTKDHALVPKKTRDEIILQGLDALDETLDKQANYGVAELAALSHGVVDLPANKIERLNPIAVEQALGVIQGTSDDDDDGLRQRACLSPEQRKAWRDQIVKNYGEPEKWSVATITTLCCSLQLLDEDDLNKMNKEGITVCKCASDMAPPSHLIERKKALDNNCNYELGKDKKGAQNTYDKIKSAKSLDLDDLESQILIGRRRRDTDGKKSEKLSCYALRLTGSASGFDTSVLETLDPKEMRNCLYELGHEKLSHENARILWKKFVESYDSVEKIPAESFRLANHILSGISEGEVSKLNFTNPDIVASFGRPLGLSKNVLKKMATHLEEGLKYNVDLFLTRDLMAARNILCGFEKDKIASIKPITFREALPILRSIEPSCEQTRLAALATKATDPQVFGEVSNWSAADVRGVGTLLKGMTTEAKSIPPEAFLGLTPTVAQSLTDTLKELTTEQLKFVPTFAAQSMSEDQLSLLSDEGRKSLEMTQRGPVVADTSSTVLTCTWTILLLVTAQIIIL